MQEMMNSQEGRKATGPEHILKEYRQQLIELVYDINEFSLKTGKGSREMKRANMIPIYKNGSKEKLLNYKPVSLTSCIHTL